MVTSCIIFWILPQYFYLLYIPFYIPYLKESENVTSGCNVPRPAGCG
jgi:hypothetical protein